MIKTSILFFVFLIVISPLPSYAQIIYLGELRLYQFQLERYHGADALKNEIRYNFFKKNYTVNIYKLVNGKMDKSTPFKSAIFPKEDYYNKTYANAEIRIEIPENYINKLNGSPLELQAEFAPTGRNGLPNLPGHKFKIYDKRDSIVYINNMTRKLEKGLSIGAPEEVAIAIVLDYLKDRLDRTSDDEDGFSRIVRNLEKLPLDTLVVTPPGYTRLVEFSRLFHFIDPFVHPNSFLNDEARKLQGKIDSLKNYLNDSLTVGTSKETRDSIQAGLDFALDIYSQYENLMDRLNRYHDKLEVILFPPSYRQVLRIDYPGNKPEKKSRDKKPYRFVFGPGVSYFWERLYDVAISPVDTTVQFERMPSLRPTLSAGLIWYPFSRKGMSIKSDSIEVRPTRAFSRNPFSLGILLDYHLLDLPSRSGADARLGMSFVCGYSIRNLSIMAKTGIGLAPTRQPRKFFIDDFNGKDLQVFLPGSSAPATSLNVNDNTLFIDKFLFGIGLSLLFSLN